MEGRKEEKRRHRMERGQEMKDAGKGRPEKCKTRTRMDKGGGGSNGMGQNRGVESWRQASRERNSDGWTRGKPD